MGRTRLRFSFLENIYLSLWEVIEKVLIIYSDDNKVLVNRSGTDIMPSRFFYNFAFYYCAGSFAYFFL